MRLTRTLQFLLTFDPVQQNVTAERNPAGMVEGTDDFNDGGGTSIKLAPLASNVVIPVPNPTGFLYLQSDQPITFSINGGAAVSLTPRNQMQNGPTPAPVVATIPAVLYLDGNGITSLTVSNPSSINTANVQWAASGV